MGLAINGDTVHGLAIGGQAFTTGGSDDPNIAKFLKYYGKKIHSNEASLFYSFSNEDGKKILNLVNHFGSHVGNVIGLIHAPYYRVETFAGDFNNGQWTNWGWRDSALYQNEYFYIIDMTGEYNVNPSYSSSGIGDDTWQGDTDYNYMIRASLVDDSSLGDYKN